LTSDVEPDVRVRANRIPNDPLYAQEAPYLDAVHAPAAWDTATASPGVLIAVIDTGIDLTQPDLAAQLWTNPGEVAADGLDHDGNCCVADVHGRAFVPPEAGDPSCAYTTAAPNGDVSDDDGHGTFVSGVTAAAGNDGVGVAGVTWGARILPVKVLDCTETGRI